jgi:serine/threonine protein kinase
MTDSDRGVVNDIKAASVEVLLNTARDVYLEKTGLTSTFPASENANPDSNSDIDSSFVNNTGGIPRFTPRELVVRKVLGRGAFCVVREVSLNVSSGGSLGSGSSRGSFFHFSSSTRKSSVQRNSSSSLRMSTSEHSISSIPRGSTRKSSARSRFVVKQINPELIQHDRIAFLKGVVDLATETRYLSTFDHNNIIKLEGIAVCDAFTKGYFIILERVDLTLAKKVKEWMDIDRTCKGITGVFTGSKKKVHKLQTDRMTAAYDLACGMNYLHQRKIVFRDLVRSINMNKKQMGFITCLFLTYDLPPK